MKKITSMSCAAMMTGMAVIATPAPAMPVQKPHAELTASDVQQIGGRRGYYHRGYRGRGYGDDDWLWVPGAAFIAGAIIGGILSDQREPEYRPRYRVHNGDAHVRWCYDRWRSYREWDDTYQPYNGPRRLCYSPY